MASSSSDKWTSQWAADVENSYEEYYKQTVKKPNPAYQQIVRAFLVDHASNVYEKTLELISKINGRQPKKGPCVRYCIIRELKAFLESGQGGQSFLNPDLQLRALKVAIQRKTKGWIDIVCDVFRVEDMSLQLLLPVVNNLLVEKEYQEAAFIVSKVNLQKHFTLEQYLLPLLLQDKLSVMEDCIKDCPEAASSLVSYLDKAARDMTPLRQLFKQVPGARPDKLDSRFLTKLIKRLMKTHKVDDSTCPLTQQTKTIQALRYMLYKKYREGTLSGENWNELVESTIGESKEVQEEFVYLLCDYSDIREAHKWAKKYNLPKERQPSALQNYEPPVAVNEPFIDWDPIETVSPNDLQLRLNLDDVHFIDTPQRFEEVIREITENYDVVGIDCEWKPVLGVTQELEKVALLQIATWDDVYLLDVMSLFECTSLWQQFVGSIIDSRILTLGFGIKHDLNVLRDTFRGKVIFKAQRVLDLSMFSEWIWDEMDHPSASGSSESASGLKGLSKLVYALLGKVVRKEEQFSDWERRPLRKDQLKYAAIDAYCLLQVFEEMFSRCAANKVNLYEKVDLFFTIKKGVFKKVQTFPMDENDAIVFPITPINKFRCVVDTMLQGLGRNLRVCGADVLVLESSDNHHEAAKIGLKEDRIVLTCGAPYDEMRRHLKPGHCYRVPNNMSSYDQMQVVLQRFNLRVTQEDLFSRCVKCNQNLFQRIPSSHLRDLFQKKLQSNVNPKLGNGREIKLEGMDFKAFDRVNEFHVCISCGQIYWEGCHHDRYKRKVQELLFANKSQKLGASPGKRFVESNSIETIHLDD